MPLIYVCPSEGGVGKTTLAANLAYSLARAGSKALALDFDVQSALRLHLDMPLSDEWGYMAKALELYDWGQRTLSANGSIFVPPYDEMNEAQCQAFDEQLTHNDRLLQRGLSALLNYSGLIVIADMPPGPLSTLKTLTGLAGLHLIPLLTDTASMSTLTYVEKQRLTGGTLDHKHGHYFVINQSDSHRQVSRDVTSLMEEKLGGRLLGVIRCDESVVEANASQKSVLDSNTPPVVAFNTGITAKKISLLLGTRTDDGTVHGQPRMSGL